MFYEHTSFWQRHESNFKTSRDDKVIYEHYLLPTQKNMSFSVKQTCVSLIKRFVSLDQNQTHLFTYRPCKSLLQHSLFRKGNVINLLFSREEKSFKCLSSNFRTKFIYSVRCSFFIVPFFGFDINVVYLYRWLKAHVSRSYHVFRFTNKQTHSS